MSDSCKTAESKRWMDDTNMDKLKSLEKRKLENLPTPYQKTTFEIQASSEKQTADTRKERRK